MKKRDYFVLAIVVLFGSLSTHFFVSAATSTPTYSATTTPDVAAIDKEIQLRKDKILQLEKTISNYNTIIVQKQTEAVSLKNQLSILDNRIAQLGADLDLTNEKIKETQLEIDALNLTIQDKQTVISKQKKIVAKMVDNIHASDQKNFFEIMLTYRNFADFYNELRSIESVYVDIGRSVKAIRLAMEDLQAKQQQVLIKKQKFNELKDELEVSKSNIEGEESLKQSLLTETKSSEARFRTLLASQRSQVQQIENEERSFEEKKQKQLEAQDKIEKDGSVMMAWPVPSRVINATFHDPSYPFKRVMEHSGIDIRASQGTAVRAAASGYVARARRCTTASCYSYILIVHTGSLSSLYGHLSGINVAEDQFVNRGDIIGYSGGTPGMVGSGPFVTGPHLHFEARLNGIPVDPMPYMAP